VPASSLPQFFSVELVGRYSNPRSLETVSQAAEAITNIEPKTSQAVSNLRVHGPWRLRDRLGEQVIASILRDSQAGTTQRRLAERYGISLSSVKRVLRTHL
jgi:hypothetical protein